MRPMLYLTNFARVTAVRAGSNRFAREVGPGHAFGIMRHWRLWEDMAVAGHIVSLMPTAARLSAFKAGAVTFDAYATGLRASWAQRVRDGVYAPGRLRYGTVLVGAGREAGAQWDGVWWEALGEVEDGATLCCCCADADRCHRSVAAEVLAASGWRVVLDGVEVRG